MNFDLNHINESFMHKIKQVKDEKKTDGLADRIAKDDRLITFACPELAYYLSRKFNNGHPFTASSAANCRIEFTVELLDDFEKSESKEAGFHSYTFNEMQYFEKSGLRYDSTDSIKSENNAYSQLLTEVTLPPSWNRIPDQAFMHFSGLKKVNFGDGIKIIDYEAFMESGVEEMFIPDTVDKIGRWVCSNCDNLTKVVFENRTHPLDFSDGGDGGYFDDCNKLKSVKLPKSITCYPSEFLGNDISIEELEIPADYEFFLSSWIKGCTSLRKIIFHGKTKFTSFFMSTDFGGLKQGQITCYFPKE